MFIRCCVAIQDPARAPRLAGDWGKICSLRFWCPIHPPMPGEPCRHGAAAPRSPSRQRLPPHFSSYVSLVHFVATLGSCACFPAAAVDVVDRGGACNSLTSQPVRAYNFSSTNTATSGGAPNYYTSGAPTAPAATVVKRSSSASRYRGTTDAHASRTVRPCTRLVRLLLFFLLFCVPSCIVIPHPPSCRHCVYSTLVRRAEHWRRACINIIGQVGRVAVVAAAATATADVPATGAGVVSRRVLPGGYHCEPCAADR
jgi:hypothetical protein